MALTAAQRTDLIELLVDNMPAKTFLEIVAEQRVMADIEMLRKQAPEDPTEARRFFATRAVDAYDATDRIPQLATAVYRQTYLDDQLAPKIKAYAALDADAGASDAAKEAAIAKRANTMSSQALRRFLAENEGKICLVVATDDTPGAKAPVRMGTGFLVGPDVVLTAYHTLVDHIDKGAARNPGPGRRYAIFDYYEGDPLRSIDPLPAVATCVKFADDWLLKSKPDMPDDGLFRQPDANQLVALPERLDFALVRLAEPIGKQTRRQAGGERRSWLKLSAAALALAQDDRIIIPQHPNGYPQRIDFGRFSQADSVLDASLTRLRYDTETDKGTSGAPCFDQNFRVVGMHNAAFMPDKVDVKKNQAVRIERIVAAIGPIPGESDPEEAAVRLWNVSTMSEPRVILGRETLLDWLENAGAEQSRSTSDRVYAAYPKPSDLANSHGFGKTFTIEILQAARRKHAEPVVLLGTEDDPLPDTVPDIMRAIGFQLGIGKAMLDTMPPRPSADLPAGAPNADKLRRWASEDVPAWFDGVLGRFREQTVDLREGARRRVKLAQDAGEPPGPEDLRLAQELTPQPGTLRRWPIAWIVIGNLLNGRMSEEVRDLLAGLIGGKATEASMPQQLRRLRWAFIGYVPDFLSTDQVTAEPLDPRTIGGDELIVGIRRLADSMAVAVDANGEAVASGLIDVVLDPDEGVPAVGDPTRRLPYFQQKLFPRVLTKIQTFLKRP